MLKYLAKRILLFIPTIFVISLVAFWLNRLAPGDPVEACMPEVEGDYMLTEKAYQRTAQAFGYDLPLFYFSIGTAAYPDTLYKIPNRFKRKTYSKLIGQYGNWPEIQEYGSQLRAIEKTISDLPDSLDRNTVINLRRIIQILPLEYQDKVITRKLQSLDKEAQKDAEVFALLSPLIKNLQTAHERIKSEATPGRMYVPAFNWYGSGNQYHRWISRFMQGDFGISCHNGQPVAERLKMPIFWTMCMNLTAIFLAYMLSIPLGLFSAVKRNTLADRVTTIFLFVLYSLPSFWIATLLIVFVTTPEYGMNWFEGIGLGNLPSSAPFWDRFWETSKHLMLPIFCLTYGGLAFLSRQVRGSMLEVLESDYIRTAKAKGVSPGKVIWKHAFRNAAFPLITLFALVFPSAIAGSVIIERIFNIPGMGQELINAILSKDWNIVYTVLMLAAILTMVGNLVADILYVLIDPRVSFRKDK